MSLVFDHIAVIGKICQYPEYVSLTLPAYQYDSIRLRAPRQRVGKEGLEAAGP